MSPGPFPSLGLIGVVHDTASYLYKLGSNITPLDRDLAQTIGSKTEEPHARVKVV